jgi:alpha-2-macroglobulin
LNTNARWLFAALLAGAVTACSPRAALPAPPDDRPHVVAFEPGDELARTDAAIRIRFDRPMVSVDAVGPALAPVPVQLEPELPLRAHWEDTKTLLLRPELEWKGSTRYTVALGAQLARPLKPPHSWTFDVLPLRLSGSSVSGDNASRSPQLVLYFNAEVDRQAVAQRCVLEPIAGKRVALRLLPQPDQRHDAQHVALTPVARLPELTHYVVDCPGLTARAGTAPFRLQRDRAHGFTTHGPLEVLRSQPAQGTASAPEQAMICLQLSTPVSLEQVAAHVHVSPKPEGLAESWYQGSCNPNEWNDTDRASGIVLAPRRGYRVSVDAELTDEFGQRLGRAHVWSFETSDRQPGLWSNQGTASVFELGQTGHGVGALNMPAVSMSCARLTPAQLATEFETINRWLNEWVDAPLPQRVPAPWAALDVPALSHSLDTSVAANVGRNVEIDLGARCGKTAGAPGLYASALEPSGLPGDRVLQQPRARLLANVTDLALVAKRGERTGLVWVTRFSNGALVPGATVQALDVDGRVLATARSDAQGLARFAKLPVTGGGRAHTFYSAQLGQDIAVVGTEWTWREGLQPYQFGVREQYEDERARLFVHLDRGVYRPGERVLLHGLVRAIPDLGPAHVPPGAAARLVVRFGTDVIERSLAVSDFGSFATELDVPKHVAPGSYAIELEVAGKQLSQTLRIAEFRPLTFELNGGPAQKELLAPAKVEVAINARYLFGAPVPAAELRWTVERSPTTIQPAGFGDYSFADSAPALPSEEPLPEQATGIVLERAAKTDAQGAAKLDFPTAAVRGPTRYAITVEAEDSGHDVASRAFSVLAHSAERYPGVRLGSELYAAGEPIAAEIVVVDRDGRAVAGDVELELREARWDCSDPKQGCHAKVSVLETQRVSVAASKPTIARFFAKAQGDVHVRALTRDGGGRSARASAMTWVWWWEGAGPYNDRVAATLSVDKRRYRPGERARLALQTPLAPKHYLLTAERGDVLSAKVIAMQAPGAAGAGPAPELALPPRAAPNVFLTMTAATPRSAPGQAGKPRLVAGAREVAVSGQSRVLEAKLVLPRTRFEPKQRVEGEVVVTHLGKPVLAEVALVAVNESVLQLTDFATPDPTEVFHAPRGLSVITSSNVTRVIGDLAAATAIPAVARLEEGGQDGGGGRPELRNDYVAAAYWAPALRTDTKGRARFAFDAPTDLSAYRLMAVVSARDDRVGSTDARIEVQQPLSVHPLSPRFASAGDELELGALVHDHTETPGAIDLRWSAKGLTIAQPSASLPAADPGGRTSYTRAVVEPGERASFDVQVSKGGATDRVGRELAVRRPLDRELRVLAQLRAASVKTALAWPAGIDRELSRLELTVDRVGLAPLAPLLAVVLEYPYGCTEQTAAALSAIAAAPELAAALVPAWRDRPALEAHVAEGVGRLNLARHGDGGYGLYPGMESRPWLTAYVLEAVLALQRMGIAQSPDLIERSRRELNEWLSQRQPAKLTVAELETAAHLVSTLAMAGAEPAGHEDRVWAERARLRVAGRAYLLHALALRKLAPERRNALRASLADARLHKRQRVIDDPFGSNESEAALALRALNADGGDPELQRELADWLIARASDPETYLSTRDIAETLTALAAYAQSASSGAAQVELGLGSKVLFSGKLSGMQVVAIDQPASASPAGELWLRADGPVSVSIRRRDVSPSNPKPEFSRGLTLVRRYLDPKSNAPLTKVAIGDLVLVALELRSDHALRMLALSDPLPAGLDPVDPGLSTGRVGGCTRCDESGGFDYVRRHDDRIEAFAEWLPKGTHAMRYMMRATVAGSFTAPGAIVQPMYLPNLFARSHVGRMQISR